VEELFLPAIECTVHGVIEVRQTELHTADTLVPEPSASEVELAIGQIKSHKSPGIDQIPAKLIRAEVRKILSEIHKLIISIWKKEKLPEEWEEPIILPISHKGDKTVCSDYRSISRLPNFHPTDLRQNKKKTLSHF
jgi:hypothetical protein